MAFVVETDVQVLRAGETLTVEGFDRDYPNEHYTMEMRRYRAGDVRDTDNDPVVETHDVALDKDGFFSLFWQPANTLNFLGPKYRYYPKIIRNADPTHWQAAAKDIRVLNRTYGLLERLATFLGPLQDMHIYDLKSKDSNIDDRTAFGFTYGNWREDRDVLAYLANDTGEQYQQDYRVDYENGKVIFDAIVPAYNDVYATFGLSLYSDDALRTFLIESVRALNYTRPVSTYNVENIPDYWEPYVLAGAASRAIAQLKTETLYKEKMFLFSSASVINQLASYQDYLVKEVEYAQANKNRWGRISPHAITGFDVMAPPRVTPQNFGSMAYLRGRAL